MNDAKAFLKQLEKLDKIIENKLIEKRQWLDMATGTTGQMGGERVQSSGSQQKMADAVGRYVDIEADIDAYIDRLVDAKRDVLSVIEQLDLVEYDLLHKIYVQYIPIYEVGDHFGKTYSWATTIHGRALKNVQRILEGRAEGEE